jgi:hypothetical protein
VAAAPRAAATEVTTFTCSAGTLSASAVPNATS